jgi:hypothetical protein
LPVVPGCLRCHLVAFRNMVTCCRRLPVVPRFPLSRTAFCNIIGCLLSLVAHCSIVACCHWLPVVSGCLLWAGCRWSLIACLSVAACCRQSQLLLVAWCRCVCLLSLTFLLSSGCLLSLGLVLLPVACCFLVSCCYWLPVVPRCLLAPGCLS